MTKLTRRTVRVAVALALFAAFFIVCKATPLREWEDAAGRWNFADPKLYAIALPYLAIFFLAGWDVIYKSVRNLIKGQLLDENFLMTVASVGAIVLGDFGEAVAVMLFYQVGELFQSYAVGKSRKSIAALMDIRPDTACVYRDGAEQIVSPEEVAVGDIVVVRAGERVPVDGTVVFGGGSLDTSSLTGESVPRDFTEGDEVLSGSINLTGVIRVRAEKEFYDSTVSRILDLVENASSKKAKTESFITKFAKYYTPAVVVSALFIAVVPPLFMGGWAEWIKRALTFLVVSCPCALVISVPLAFFGGIGGASREGILMKGGSSLELLNAAKLFAFDKTGTITEGKFGVKAVLPEERREEILSLAAIAESGSSHPIARSVLAAAPEVNAEGYRIEEMAGFGVRAEREGDVILVGNERLMEREGVAFDRPEIHGSALYLAKNGIFMGTIVIGDKIKEGSKEAVEALGRESTFMLTGDAEGAAQAVAMEAGVGEYASGLLPADKVEKVLELKKRGSVCFVGDGINDAPVLAAADVGISMGGIGSDAAIEASDIVLMHDDLRSIIKARKIARRTILISRENIVFALGVKLAVLVLSAFGITGMWLAVFADVGVAVLAILNSMRCLATRRL